MPPYPRIYVAWDIAVASPTQGPAQATPPRSLIELRCAESLMSHKMHYDNCAVLSETLYSLGF
jgi:hypothetical protein